MFIVEATEVAYSGKRSSLQPYGINYERKKY